MSLLGLLCSIALVSPVYGLRYGTATCHYGFELVHASDWDDMEIDMPGPRISKPEVAALLAMFLLIAMYAVWKYLIFHSLVHRCASVASSSDVGLADTIQDRQTYEDALRHF